MTKCCDSCRQVARIVLRGVAEGKTVEIDGLGIFYPDARRGFFRMPSPDCDTLEVSPLTVRFPR